MAQQILVEHNFSTEALCEGSGALKNWYLSGIFMQAYVVNKNKRNYPRSIMESAVHNYNTNFVLTKVAAGELCQPQNT